jgi:hypothetical protein
MPPLEAASEAFDQSLMYSPSVMASIGSSPPI